MSPLRQRLKQPSTYLLAIVIFGCLVGLDSTRVPERQCSAAAYLSLVNLYQRAARPWLTSYVRCRFHPTCSEYSMAAVRAFGIRRGLTLTASRLWRCRGSVPLGTEDPVPLPAGH